MNLTDLQTQLYQRLRLPSSPPSATTTRLTAMINRVHTDILSNPALMRLRDDCIPVTALANQSRTGLPPIVARINGIVDRTNNLKLVQVPLSELRFNDPARAFTGGFPLRYSVIGNQAVQIQPATSGVWVVSSSAADTTQKAYVESIVTGGYPNQIISAGTALNGVTRVQVGALTSHIEVTRFYIDAVGAGSISLYDAAAAGNELARIPIGLTFSRYLAVEWWPIQTADVTDYADITRAVFDLVKGTDEPLIPVDFHDMILDGVLSMEWTVTDDARLGVAKANYQKQLDDLTNWVMNDGDRIASLRPMPLRWSPFGGSYPAQRYY